MAKKHPSLLYTSSYTQRSGGDVSDLFVPVAKHARPTQTLIPHRRILLLGIGALLCVVSLLFFRSSYLQLFRGLSYRAQAEGNRIRYLVDYAPRGVIIDTHGVQLVQNIPSTYVVIYPPQLPTDMEAHIRILRAIFPTIPVTQFQEAFSRIERNSPKPVPLLQNITHEQLLAVLAQSNHLSGIGVENRAVRQYAGEGLFAHILGYTGRLSAEDYEAHPDYLFTESIGKSGLESVYEKELRGTHGARRVEIDAAGNVQHELGTMPAVAGMNVRLHIDANLQKHLADSLKQHMEEAQVQHASAIAIDPRSGAVRALVNIPTYDDSALARGLTHKEAADIFSNQDQPLLNRAIQGEYPPGSTFKIAVAAGALEEGIANATTTVESTGGLHVGPWFFPDWKSGGHGTTDIVKALAESVNTFFYIIGGGYQNTSGLGIERMTAWAGRLGFGKETGIDLPGEKDGFLPSEQWKKDIKHETWYIGDTYHAAIGQGDVLVTPLQLALVTATIANGGTLYIPHIVDAFVRNDQSVIRHIEPSIRAQHILKDSTIDLLRQGMRAAVTSGSARALASLPVPVAGKTGTAQTGSGITNTNAWFTSFAPFDNPELVLTILIEKGGGGDRFAVPVAKDIYSWYFGDRQPSPPLSSSPTP